MEQILVNSSVTEDFEQFPQENGASIRELGTLLVKLTHLLVSLKQILVNSSVTQKYEKFPYEIGASSQEIEVLLVIKLFWRISIKRRMDKKIIMKTPG